jgi:hypothetical protein
MTDPDPKKRPTAFEALTLFTELRKQVPPELLAVGLSGYGKAPLAFF